MSDTNPARVMQSGIPYEIHSCQDPVFQLTPDHLREEICNAFKCLSARSRWHRFATPINKLSEKQLDLLTDLDGKNRVALCAVIHRENTYRGIGLARYIRLPEADAIAEFAVTVLDEFQGQGIGRAMLEQLIRTARINGFKVLRGYVLPGNRGMLKLCRQLHASIAYEDAFARVDIAVPADEDRPDPGPPD
jgi:GNAT superfamily N-acetyltransferase